MTLYVDDPAADQIILCVVNDGSGSQCGASYTERCNYARENDLFKFRLMAREYGRYAHKKFGSPIPSRAATVAAGDYLFKYYIEHLKEF
jgi:hypothetical protein